MAVSIVIARRQADEINRRASSFQLLYSPWSRSEKLELLDPRGNLQSLSLDCAFAAR